MAGRVPACDDFCTERCAIVWNFARSFEGINIATVVTDVEDRHTLCASLKVMGSELLKFSLSIHEPMAQYLLHGTVINPLLRHAG